MRAIGLLGGSFNPFHIGHLRLAIEVLERLKLTRVDITPCSVPPHKATSDLLPFELRAQCISRSIGSEAGEHNVPGLALNTMERERPGPSYTCDTLAEYAQREPDARVHFVLGAGDILTLPSWKQGLQLPDLASLVIVPRQKRDLADVSGFVEEHWPEATPVTPPQGVTAWNFPQGTQLIYLPLPRIDISGEMIRERWREGRSLPGLIPGAALSLLLREAETVAQFWGKNGVAS